jgi:hypothetical protein
MARVEPKIRRARFVLSPFSSEQMLQVGNRLADSIRARISSGLNADDQAAKALKVTGAGKQRRGYMFQKLVKGKKPVRDWTFSGDTLRAMGVLSVNENRGVIGFTDAHADLVAHVNNQRERAFAVSPKDREVLVRAVHEVKATSVKIEGAA